MRKHVFSALLLAALGCAAGEYITRAFGPEGAAVTNSQQNAAWELSAVAIRFGDVLPVATETVRVSRVSRDVEFVLSETQVFGHSMILAAPEKITYSFGDCVRVYGGGATGTVQIFTTAQ